MTSPEPLSTEGMAREFFEKNEPWLTPCRPICPQDVALRECGDCTVLHNLLALLNAAYDSAAGILDDLSEKAHEMGMSAKTEEVKVWYEERRAAYRLAKRKILELKSTVSDVPDRAKHAR